MTNEEILENLESYVSLVVKIEGLEKTVSPTFESAKEELKKEKEHLEQMQKVIYSELQGKSSVVLCELIQRLSVRIGGLVDKSKEAYLNYADKMLSAVKIEAYQKSYEKSRVIHEEAVKTRIEAEELSRKAQIYGSWTHYISSSVKNNISEMTNHETIESGTVLK